MPELVRLRALMFRGHEHRHDGPDVAGVGRAPIRGGSRRSAEPSGRSTRSLSSAGRQQAVALGHELGDLIPAAFRGHLHAHLVAAPPARRTAGRCRGARRAHRRRTGRSEASPAHPSPTPGHTLEANRGRRQGRERRCACGSATAHPPTPAPRTPQEGRGRPRKPIEDLRWDVGGSGHAPFLLTLATSFAGGDPSTGPHRREHARDESDQAGGPP